MPEKESPPEALWNLLGLTGFFFSIIIAFVVLKTPPSGGGDSWGWGRLAMAIFVFTGAITLSFICSIVGLVRGEKLGAITIIGLLLNGLPFLGIFTLIPHVMHN